jgi:hypothetical protein
MFSLSTSTLAPRACRRSGSPPAGWRPPTVPARNKTLRRGLVWIVQVRAHAPCILELLLVVEVCRRDAVVRVEVIVLVLHPPHVDQGRQLGVDASPMADAGDDDGGALSPANAAPAVMLEDVDADHACRADLVVAAQPDRHPLEKLHAHRALRMVVDDAVAVVAVIASGNGALGMYIDDGVAVVAVIASGNGALGMYIDDGVAVVTVIASGNGALIMYVDDGVAVVVQLRHDRVYLHACARSSVCVTKE